MRRLFPMAAAFVAVALPVRADVHLVPNKNGPLAGKTIVFSPGHGKFRDNGTWRFQRGIVHGLREDIHTNEIFIQYVQRYLANAGARVESCRERSFQKHEVIVDNGGAGYSETGTWSSSTSAPRFYGTNYRYAAVSSSETATATFRPTLPAAGRYPVYVWYTKSANRSTDARFVVHHTGGQTTVVVNQQLPGDHWTFLGEFHFAAGTTGKVVLGNRGSDSSKFVIADGVRFGGGVGASGLPRWREAAKEFLPHKGFSSTRGDVTIRPTYGTWLAGGDTTRWRSDFLYVALHSNASGSTGQARGLSTFAYSNGRTPSWGSAGAVTYPTVPSPLTTQSEALRNSLQAEVLAAVRARFEPSWRDRGLHLMNFGELRESRNMPSALIELGFHDNAQDVALLANSRFRAVAGRAIYKGVIKYWLGANTTIIPLPPRDLRLENQGGGQVRVRWNPTTDTLEPSAAPTSYKLYLSADGHGFDDGRQVSGTSHTLSGLQPGQRVYVRVAALNAGGESLPTRVGGARVGNVRKTLVVDGFTRAFTHSESNIDSRFTYDYAPQHVEALAAALPQAGIDYASHTTVAAGQVQLGGYALVDWLLGRESSVDRTFDPSEQTLVETYLQSGGALFASGTEIGWDLKARSGGERFLEQVLGVRYVQDDAGARSLRAAGSSPFTGLGTLTLDDGTQGSYDAAYPDVLEPFSSSGVTLLSYENAGVQPAGVGQTAPYKVVVLGFPLEAVTDGAKRTQLATSVVGFLLPAGTTPPPPAGGGGSTPPPSGGATPPPGGGSTGPVATSTTSAPATAAPATAAPSRRSSGSGCTLAAGERAPAWPGLLLLLVLLLLHDQRHRFAAALLADVGGDGDGVAPGPAGGAVMVAGLG